MKRRRLSPSDKRRIHGADAEERAEICPICHSPLRQWTRPEALAFFAPSGVWKGAGGIPCADKTCSNDHFWNIEHNAQYRWVPRKQIVREHLSRTCLRMFVESGRILGFIFIVTDRLGRETERAIRTFEDAERMDVPQGTTVKLIWRKDGV